MSTDFTAEEGYWNHRVMRHRAKFHNQGPEKVWYEIHEVFYKGDGTITGWTKIAVNAHGEDLDSLTEYLELMRESLKHPILDYDGETKQ